jgi:hypothetical protein
MDKVARWTRRIRGKPEHEPPPEVEEPAEAPRETEP